MTMTGAAGVGEDLCPREFREAIDVDENVDFVSADLLCRFDIAERIDVAPAIHGILDPHLRCVVGTRFAAIISEELSTPALVMQLQNFPERKPTA